jgi:hypothetical protein
MYERTLARRTRRKAHRYGGRLRPHREPRIAVRQGHIHVRDTRLAEPAQDPPLPSTGQRPLGGHLLGGRDLFHWSLCSKEHVELIPSVFVNYPQIIKKRELLGRAAMLWPGSDMSSAIFTLFASYPRLRLFHWQVVPISESQ